MKAEKMPTLPYPAGSVELWMLFNREDVKEQQRRRELAWMRQLYGDGDCPRRCP